MSTRPLSLGPAALAASAALAIGCGGPTPSARLPDAPPPPAAIAAPRSSTAAAPPAPAPPDHAASPCAPRAARAVRVATRSGSSIAMVEDGARRLVYVADEDHGAIHVLDADAGPPAAVSPGKPPAPPAPVEIAVTPLPGRPTQLLPLPDGRLLVTLRDRNRLLALEPGDRPEDGLRVLCERPTYTEPWGLAASADGARVAVTAGWDHRLMLFDARRLELERAVDVAPEPRGVLIPERGDVAYVAHLRGGVVSAVPLARPGEPVRRIIARAEPPRRDPPARKAGAKAPPAPPAPEQERASAQGYALAEIPLHQGAPGRLFAPMASSDPMRFGAAVSFPSVYGGGGGGPAVIGAFVAVIDPVLGAPLGGEVAPLREGRPEDCILPRGAAAHRGKLLLVCQGIDDLIELDARAVDPISAEQRRFEVGAGPTGVAVDAAQDRAFVYAQWANAVTVVDLAREPRLPVSSTLGGSAGASPAAPPNPVLLRLARPEQPALAPQIARGRELFHVTRDVRMSVDGRACASCHPEGRADGLTWATPDGPRQTIALAGRAAASGPYGWFGDHPTMKSHVSLTVRRLGGHGFDSVTAMGGPEDLDALLAYVASLPAPSREGALVDEGVAAARARGRDLFFSEETGCAACHLEAASDGRRHDVGSGDPREKRLAFDTPALRLVAGSAPYFHDGRYPTLMDLLSDPRSTMGRSAHLPEPDRRALAAYLESL